MELLLKKVAVLSNILVFVQLCSHHQWLQKRTNWVGEAALPDTSLDSSLSAVDNWDCSRCSTHRNANSDSIVYTSMV